MRKILSLLFVFIVFILFCLIPIQTPLHLVDHMNQTSVLEDQKITTEITQLEEKPANPFSLRSPALYSYSSFPFLYNLSLSNTFAPSFPFLSLPASSFLLNTTPALSYSPLKVNEN
ncbi:hypothetical protein EHS13_31485 [Paenibacillus psychroresistens]|uniref:Uncharacterized protein n=1 Tax=Paenibacillus psychroresistens TaxID=1778678 RepID=A0A6B8RRR7_9BACL|nr:hypothetical protein [Paenibacillus psychroresistens]QGQ99080.1 hypothetical protein EHS13_31485 [Paenibacillus psychroresistens]